MIIDPVRFKNDADGPCHSDIDRKKFWTAVLQSLKLSFDLICSEAKRVNDLRKIDDEDYIPDLENRIEIIKATQNLNKIFEEIILYISIKKIN